MFCVLHLTDVVARFFPGGIEGRYKSGPEVIKIASEVLEDSLLGFPVAGLFKEMIERTAKACTIRITLGQPDVEYRYARKVYQLQNFLDAFTRPTYIQPVEEVRGRFLSSLSAEWLVHGPSFGLGSSEQAVNSATTGPIFPAEEASAAENLMRMRVTNLLNTK